MSEYTDSGMKRILIVEDDDLQREILFRRLQKLGCLVDQAEDGKSALRKWEHNAYDLIITDCHMPNIDGFELSDTIRRRESENAERPRTRIVAFSADITSATQVRISESGIDDFVTKPFSSDSLLAAINPKNFLQPH